MFKLMDGGNQITGGINTVNSSISTYDWFSYDDKKNYEINLKKQPKDWIWRNQKVTYTVNSQRYRCQEWSDIDWENSTVVFGCSMVFGLGLDDDQTITAHLSKKLKTNVINLGVAGSSAMFQWINTTKLISQGRQPARAIYIWPHHFRVADILDETRHKSCGRWNFDTNDLAKAWNNRNQHSLEYAKLCIESTTQQLTCPTHHYTWCLDTGNYIKTIVRFPFTEYVDYSRDTKHPGPKTIEMWADKIVADINMTKQL
jgi:hypothetical protein